MWTRRLTKLIICGLFETVYITGKVHFIILYWIFF